MAKSAAKRAGKPAASGDQHENFMPAPRWRRERAGNISAPTFWRWRNHETLNFPACKVINGRVYVPERAAAEWLASRPDDR
jgi:hypothetical protein